MQAQPSCPVCQEGKLENQIGNNLVEYQGIKQELLVHYAVCNSCSSEIALPEQILTNKRLMLAFKKQVEGLLTGCEVRQLRESLGINQSQAAQIFGGEPVAFSKYENDDVMQSEAMDKLLRLAVEVPEAFKNLATKAKIKITKHTSHLKINTPTDNQQIYS